MDVSLTHPLNAKGEPAHGAASAERCVVAAENRECDKVKKYDELSR